MAPNKWFDVDAIIPSDARIGQANERLQALLKERFGLQSRLATREQAGYNIDCWKGRAEFESVFPTAPRRTKARRHVEHRDEDEKSGANGQ
ncbi:MAG: DUF3738 domain-containing protein [Acidobacteria bacterium]|nr:DUF3738 domain-containing protein [Acidobacteriota bacterium]